jgi:hypothetical protein
MGCADYMNLPADMRKTYTEIQSKVRSTSFHFSCWVWVFLDDTENRWVKDFACACVYTVTQSQIHLASNVIAMAWEWMGSTASGG